MLFSYQMHPHDRFFFSVSHMCAVFNTPPVLPTSSHHVAPQLPLKFVISSSLMVIVTYLHVYTDTFYM